MPNATRHSADLAGVEIEGAERRELIVVQRHLNLARDPLLKRGQIGTQDRFGAHLSDDHSRLNDRTAGRAGVAIADGPDADCVLIGLRLQAFSPIDERKTRSIDASNHVYDISFLEGVGTQPSRKREGLCLVEFN